MRRRLSRRCDFCAFEAVAGARHILPGRASAARRRADHRRINELCSPRDGRRRISASGPQAPDWLDLPHEFDARALTVASGIACADADERSRSRMAFRSLLTSHYYFTVSRVQARRPRFIIARRSGRLHGRNSFFAFSRCFARGSRRPGLSANS